MCGGASAPRPATDVEQTLCDKIRPDLEGKSNRQFASFKAIEVSSQVVAGTNYFVKIDVGSEEFVHARIFKPLPCNGTEPQLHSYLLGKTNQDKLAYFWLHLLLIINL